MARAALFPIEHNARARGRDVILRPSLCQFPRNDPSAFCDEFRVCGLPSKPRFKRLCDCHLFFPSCARGVGFWFHVSIAPSQKNTGTGTASRDADTQAPG